MRAVHYMPHKADIFSRAMCGVRNPSERTAEEYMVTCGRCIQVLNFRARRNRTSEWAAHQAIESAAMRRRIAAQFLQEPKPCRPQYHAEAKRKEAEDAAREASECNH